MIFGAMPCAAVIAVAMTCRVMSLVLTGAS